MTNQVTDKQSGKQTAMPIFSRRTNYLDKTVQNITPEEGLVHITSKTNHDKVAHYSTLVGDPKRESKVNDFALWYLACTINNEGKPEIYSGLIPITIVADPIRSQEIWVILKRCPYTFITPKNLDASGRYVAFQAETIPVDEAQYRAYFEASISILKSIGITDKELKAANPNPTFPWWEGYDADVWTDFFPIKKVSTKSQSDFTPEQTNTPHASLNSTNVIDDLKSERQQAEGNQSSGKPNDEPTENLTEETPIDHTDNNQTGFNQEEQASGQSKKTGIEDENQEEQTNDSPRHIGLLTIRTANGWIEDAMSKSPPKKLFDGFWGEGEICILYAESNQGKTILAVQIGDGISRGRAIKGFQMEAEPQIVIYCDFELSSKQFEARYSEEFTNHYQWHSNFRRIEINTEADVPNGISFEDYLNESLEKAIEETGAKVLIIDNLTYLRTDTESAKDAGPLMKYLKLLKQKYGLSLLILAHTPKRDASRPLTRNDLQGSSRLNQFADSMFAIGSSARDSQLKYIKQVKVRSAAYRYDSDNVVVCQIVKQNSFLMFEQMRYSTEQEHLKLPTEKDTANLPEEVQTLHKAQKTQQQIALALGISQPKVSRILSKLAADK